VNTLPLPLSLHSAEGRDSKKVAGATAREDEWEYLNISMHIFLLFEKCVEMISSFLVLKFLNSIDKHLIVSTV